MSMCMCPSVCIFVQLMLNSEKMKFGSKGLSMAARGLHNKCHVAPLAHVTLALNVSCPPHVVCCVKVVPDN